MARSLLAAVHNAVVGAVDDTLDEGDTGAPALNANQKDGTMSKDNTPAGGDQNSAGITKAEHETAVNAARENGKTEGAKAATDRLVAALGAEGVKGDAARMSAALDLAAKSPAMSGEDVAAFVVGNVSATAAKPAASEAYAAKRTAAAGLAQPEGRSERKSATIDRNGIYASRRKQTQEG